MRIVLSYESFEGFAGSETYTLTVARELDRLGHDVAIYSPRRGAMAEYARRQGVRVLGADDLPRSCDVVISSDAAMVIGLGRSVLEAMASGRAACVYGVVRARRRARPSGG
jgi:hypothetical protein